MVIHGSGDVSVPKTAEEQPVAAQKLPEEKAAGDVFVAAPQANPREKFASDSVAPFLKTNAAGIKALKGKSRAAGELLEGLIKNLQSGRSLGGVVTARVDDLVAAFGKTALSAREKSALNGLIVQLSAHPDVPPTAVAGIKRKAIK